VHTLGGCRTRYVHLLKRVCATRKSRDHAHGIICLRAGVLLAGYISNCHLMRCTHVTCHATASIVGMQESNGTYAVRLQMQVH
jgi:hypothetical protein